ncbi:MAG: sodium:proton antiporter, partial [Chloroflexi bacterium]|nr:sodium:proton antiporter [Chloroflexota bacterium]
MTFPLNIENGVQVVAWMLMGAALVGMLAHRLHVPYAVALVVGGIAVEESHLVAVPHLDPGVLLFVFLPPLLFDAAFRLDERELRAVARPVLLLALPGTVATALIVGAVTTWALHLSPAVGLLFGSIVAATDPVAVVAVFRTLRTPVRLEVIAEAESLINDGVAITLYAASLPLVVTGTTDVSGAFGLFVRQVVGGVAIGVLLGMLFSRATAIIDDHRIEMTLSTALAYGSFLIAQAFETSGALACVAAGLIHGSYGRQVGMSERTRRLLDDLWEYFGFLANALVFLLVGFTVSITSLVSQAMPVIVGVVGVLVSRVLVVLGPPLLMPRRFVATSAAERAVLVWGGLRGALTITLALALPPEVADREL